MKSKVSLQEPHGIPETTLSLLHDVVTYGHEQSYITPSNELDVTLRKAFFTDLYLDRPRYEKQLLEFCTSQGSGLGIVIGVQGSGKSTIVERIQQLVDCTSFPFLVIDFKIFYKHLSKNVELWYKIVENNLEQQVTAKFLDEERIDKFFRYFLYEDEHTRPIFKEELDLIRRLFKKDRFDSQGRSPLKEEEWFTTQLPRFVDLANSIAKKLTLEHYFKAARLSTDGKIEQFVIVFDNVDRVPRHWQANLYQVAEDLRATHSTTANIIITTRKDTCHPPEQVCNVHPAPLVQIGLYGDRDMDKGRLTPAEFQEILERRLQYFRSMGKNYKYAEHIVAISRSLRDEYAEVVLIDVANQSIRDALRYHCDFVRYLLEEYPAEEIYSRLTSKAGVGSFLISCLYGWIATHGSVLNRQCLNVVELVDECSRNKFIEITGCDLTYLLLVCLFNYHRRHKNNPSVNDLFNRFRPLQYDPELIRLALFDLWDLRNEEFGQVLSIYQKELPRSHGDIRDDAEVELNYRGDRLVHQVSVSFTFINRLLYDKDNDDFYPQKNKSSIKRYYEIKYLPQHAKWSCKFLYALGFLHSLELHKIRTRYGKVDWFNQYAHDFCIGRDLQLQRIIESHCAFLHTAVGHHRRQEGEEWSTKIREAIGWLTCLSKLYDLQVKYFRPDNAQEKWILDYETLLTDIWGRRADPSDPNRLFSSGKYRKDISPML